MTTATVRLRSMPSPPSRKVALFANASAAYPLLLFACFYGEWLLSWRILGHVPRANIDDPNSIDGASWMYVPTAIVLMGFFPAAPAALVLNVWYAVDRSLSPMRTMLRVLGVAAVFAASFAWIRWDPGSVVYWWAD